MKVWTILNNGKADEQVFNNDQEGMTYAKERSLRSWCCFTANARNQFECYENGNMVSVNRKKILSKQVEEILMREEEHVWKQYRGKKSVKKQQ